MLDRFEVVVRTRCTGVGASVDVTSTQPPGKVTGTKTCADSLQPSVTATTVAEQSFSQLPSTIPGSFVPDAGTPSGRFTPDAPVVTVATIKADFTVPRADGHGVTLGDSFAVCTTSSDLSMSAFQGARSITVSNTCTRNVTNVNFDRLVTFRAVGTAAPLRTGALTGNSALPPPYVEFQVTAVYRLEELRQGDPCPYRIQSLTGEVASRRNAGEFMPVVVGQQLCLDDEVFTGVGSGVVISGFEGGLTFEIRELSQVRLFFTDRATLKDVAVNLAVGAINATVKKERVVDTNFQIQTPVAAASVRGTIFTVKYDNVSKSTTISVEEGQVEVTGAIAPLPPTAPRGLPLMLQPGQRVSVTVEAAGPVGANPAINAGGVVDAASYRPALARGGIASAFGANLAPATTVAATVPLPTRLAGTAVRVDGVLAPLYFVAPGLVNFQVPTTAPLDGEVDVVVENDGAPSVARRVAVRSYAPSVFTHPTIADPILVHLDGSLVTPQSPAVRGETLVVFATGVGDLNNPPRTNQPAPSSPLAESKIVPTVTIGGVAAPVLFSGLTPGFIGLVQINITVPDGVSSGNLPFVVSYGSASSQPGLLLPVR